MDQLSNPRYFATLDLASGYHPLLVEPQDEKKTAYISVFIHFEFNRMPFEIKGGPARFERLINIFLSSLQRVKCFLYLDDIVVFGTTLEDHNNKII